jgi:carboxymethylenebutenolidase
MSIQTRDITFDFGGQTRPGYIAQPEGKGPFPGVIVIHEAYGLNQNIRQIAGRFAEAGYAALAVDLFSGRSTVLCMFQYMGAQLLGNTDHAGVRELKAALTFLGEQPGVDSTRVGAIGFCLGGGLAITWACTDPRLKVIAPFYGANPRPLEAVERACPVVGSYPADDFTAGMGRKLDAALDGYGIKHDIKVYEGAKHSFFNDTNPSRHHPAAAADAWGRTLAFFKGQLG